MSDHATRYGAVNAAWGTDPIPPLEPKEAVTAAKKLYYEFRFRGRKERCKLKIRQTSGNRHTWIRNGTLTINAGRGWTHLVHNLSHYFASRQSNGFLPHGSHHSALEREMIAHVVEKGWLNGKLRRPAKVKAPVDLTAVRHQRVLAAIGRWEAKERRAKTALKKLRARAKYYERRGASSPDLTAT